MIRNRKHVSLKIKDTEFLSRNRPLHLFLEISGLLSTCQTHDKLLSIVLSKVLDFFHLDAGRIYLLDEDEQVLYLAAYQGVDVTGLETVMMGEGFTGKCARTRSLIAHHVTEVENRDRADLLAGKGLKFIICLPLITKNRVVGVMNVASKKVIPLDREMVDAMTATGGTIAVALENYDLIERIRQKADEVQKQKEALKFFVYSTLHDLKGPSLAIHGLTKRLHDNFQVLSAEKGQVYCDHILRASDQLLDLVQKLNTYVMAKEAGLNLEVFHLDEITETIRDEVADKLKKLNVKMSAPGGSITIEADKLSIMRIFHNMVDNALKYGGKDLNEIIIGYAEDNSFHIFSVSDNGVGIKSEDPDLVFGLYQRHETSKGIDGSGLGLAIVKELVEKHGGRVWIKPGATRGVGFYFSIPKHI